MRDFATYAEPMVQMGAVGRVLMFKGYKDDMWSPTNPNALYGAHGQWTNGQKNWRDGSYVRLKQLEVAYRFEKAFMQKLGFKSARVALQGFNVWTYSPVYYIFGDPENEPSGRDNFNNMNQLYPIPKRWTAALQFNF